MTTEIDDEKEATMVESIVELLPAAPLRLDDLATEWGVLSTDRVFRLAVWQSIERYREETGIQLRQENGEIVALTPEEQLEAAKKRFTTAATRTRRGYEIASGAARRDPAMAAKVERLFAREASKAAPQSSGELAARQRAERDALLAGKPA
jgi:hypothetical protein